MMEKVLYDRFVIDFKTWIKTLRKLCKEHNNTELIPSIKKALVNAKDKVPQKEQSAAGFNDFETEADIMGMSDYALGKVCLTFADDSIDSGGVWDDGSRIIYRSKVKNTSLFYPILLSDYLINIYRATFDIKNRALVFEIKVDSDEGDKDPFVYQMNTIFKEYFPEVEIQYVE